MSLCRLLAAAAILFGLIPVEPAGARTLQLIWSLRIEDQRPIVETNLFARGAVHGRFPVPAVPIRESSCGEFPPVIRRTILPVDPAGRPLADTVFFPPPGVPVGWGSNAWHLLVPEGTGLDLPEGYRPLSRRIDLDEEDPAAIAGWDWSPESRLGVIVTRRPTTLYLSGRGWPELKIGERTPYSTAPIAYRGGYLAVESELEQGMVLKRSRIARRNRDGALLEASDWTNGWIDEVSWGPRHSVLAFAGATSRGWFILCFDRLSRRPDTLDVVTRFDLLGPVAMRADRVLVTREGLPGSPRESTVILYDLPGPCEFVERASYTYSGFSTIEAVLSDDGRWAALEQRSSTNAEQMRLVLLDENLDLVDSLPLDDSGVRGLKFVGSDLFVGWPTRCPITTEVIRMYRVTE